MDQQSIFTDPTSAPVRLEQLDTFSDQFHGLLEVISDGARYGPTLGLQNRYSILQNELNQSFEPCKPFLFAYINSSGISLSEIEAMWKQPNLGMLIDSDDSNLIDRMNRSLDVISLYDSHLRYLLEKTA